MNTEQLYWGGNTLDGPIRPLEARGFRDLVDRYINVPHLIPMTRKGFHAMEERDRNKAKAGPYLTPCSFKPETTHRCDANGDKLVIAFFDLDDGPEVKHLCESPTTIGEALAPYDFAAYLTANSTPERPRLRIMVPTVPTHRDLHKRVIAYLADRLGVPQEFKGRRESCVFSQPMYVPVTFQGEESSPVLASRTNGVCFDPADMPEDGDAPDADDTVYAAQGSFDDSLGLAFLPVGCVTVEDIREALFKIPADCDYRTWTLVIAALRHEFREEDEARDAFYLLDEWCATGLKYKDGEPLAKWKSFRPDTVGKNPATLRTLFRFAMDNGWENTRVAGKVQQTLSEWIAACDDSNTLMLEGPKKIAALPFKSPVIEEVLVNELRARIKAISKQSIDKATILKAVKRERSSAKIEEVEDGGIESWLRAVKFIGPSNTFKNAVNGTEYTPAAFDNTFSRFLMSKDPDSEQAKLGRPVILPVQHALNVRRIDTVDGVTYDPRYGGDEIIFEFEGKRYLNEYRKSTVPMEDAARGPAAMSMLVGLLGMLIGNRTYERTLIDFMAFIVQHPGVKIRWCPIIQGGHGAGKGTIGVILAAAIGTSNYAIISPSAMSSDFNSWRYGSQVVEFDELKSPGHNRNEVSNKLKDAITNDRVSVNRKFRDPSVVVNVTNFIAFTNFFDCITVEDGDRRYFIIRSPVQSSEQVAEVKGTGIFDQIYPMATDFPGAFRHALMNHKISPDFPVNGPAPVTEYRKDMIEASKSNFHLDIDRVILSGEHPAVQKDVILLSELEAHVWNDPRRNGPVWHYLRQQGYNTINGSGIWTHPHMYKAEMGNPADIVRVRQEIGEIEI